MKKCMILLLLLLTICLLSACKGNALPDEMNEEELLSAGENILQMLTSGNCQGVYECLREDVRQQTDAAAIEELLNKATEGKGSFQKITGRMVTGITEGEQPQGIAVFQCKYQKKSIAFRIAFDPDMQLIGLDIRTK